MNWRDSSTNRDKFFASLTYLVPLLEVLPFGGELFSKIPPLEWLFYPLLRFVWPIYSFSYNGLQIVSLGLFLYLFIGVARNYKLGHFLRFNAMQSLLIAIVVFLCGALLQLLGIPIGFINNNSSLISSLSLLFASLFSAIFLAVVAASVYSIVQCVRGLYAEMPIISDAAYSQVR